MYGKHVFKLFFKPMNYIRPPSETQSTVGTHVNMEPNVQNSKENMKYRREVFCTMVLVTMKICEIYILLLLKFLQKVPKCNGHLYRLQKHHFIQGYKNLVIQIQAAKYHYDDFLLLMI